MKYVVDTTNTKCCDEAASAIDSVAEAGAPTNELFGIHIQSAVFKPGVALPEGLSLKMLWNAAKIVEDWEMDADGMPSDLVISLYRFLVLYNRGESQT